MSDRTIRNITFALAVSALVITPVLAQSFYSNPYGNPYGNPYSNPYGSPVYNNYNSRGYAPYQEYGYRQYRNRKSNHTVRNVAIGAGIGAAIGYFASHHGHRYD